MKDFVMLSRRSLLLGSAATMSLSFASCRPASLLQLTSSLRINALGLANKIVILDDRYGVPHVRASSIPDAFFGQGYVVARDRLFQMDLAHRREMGRLAEVYGPQFAAHDERARLLHYRGDVEAELARVPPNILACASAYVAGVNARIDEVVATPNLLPLEYRILNFRPLKWEIRDLVLAPGRSVGDSVNGDVRRAKLAGMRLLALEEVIAPLRPAWPLRVPEGLDVAAVSDADLGILQPGPLSFGPIAPPADDSARLHERSNDGSNAWTISPSRTVTGRAILANDPHLSIGGFGPRHVVHLTAPGLDVVGGGQPGLPGIMQGHTDRFAFGRTNFTIDQEDLFILELHPDDPELYRHQNKWRPFEKEEVSISVKDGAPKSVTLRYSVQGPVVSYDPVKRRATAFAAIQLQRGGSDAFAMISINLARDWKTLRDAFRFHPSPTNFHYADVNGNHGWQVIGFVPVRNKGDGLLPVPGDGRYDWTGMRDFRELPSQFNPKKGWFASANENNLPPDWPRDRIPAFTFPAAYRYQRIADVLTAQTRHSLSDSVALQLDTVSTPARQLITLLPVQGSAQAEPAIGLLRSWDGRLNANSAPAALFEILWGELNTRVIAAIVPDRARAIVKEIAPSVLLGLLAQPDARIGPDPVAARDALFDAALVAAWDKAKARLGADPSVWRWAALHQARITHPLSRVPAIAAAFPPIEGGGSGGDRHTVMARGYRDGTSYNVTSGASYRQIIDVGDWDNSLMINLPGQSNDPRSPHYSDHYKPWIHGEMQPMLFSRRAVDDAALHRTELYPSTVTHS